MCVIGYFDYVNKGSFNVKPDVYFSDLRDGEVCIAMEFIKSLPDWDKFSPISISCPCRRCSPSC